MMTHQLGAGFVFIHGQKPSPWVGTLGWVAANTETRSDGMLARSFLCVGRIGGRRTNGVSLLVQEMNIQPNI